MLNLDEIQLAVGGAFVLLDGWNRFNDPVHGDSAATYRALHLDSRSSTTAVSYYGALGLYLATLLTAFSLLAVNDRWIQALAGTTLLTSWLQDVGFPMLAALLMIVVVPQLKPLSTLERALRGRLQSWASIPAEVSRFAHDLQGYRFLPKEHADGADPETGESETGSWSLSDPLPRHRRASSLLGSLEAWKASRLFGGYFATFQGVYEQLVRDAARLGRQLDAYQEAVAEAGPESRAVRAQRESLEESSKQLLRQVCYFVAAGLLRCCPLESARNRELERLGFVPMNRPAPILPGQVALALLSVTGVCVAFFVANWLIGGRVDGLDGELIKSVRIASLYIAATLSAVYLWHKSDRPMSGRLSERPYHRYLAAALLAVGVCLLLSLLFWLAVNQGDLRQTFHDLGDRFYYRLLTAAVAFGIAFLLDDSWPAGVSARRQRLIEGAALGTLVALLAPLVYLLLIGGGQPEIDRLLRLVALGSTVGFLLGSCIPIWCRENRRLLAGGARPVADAEPAGVPAATAPLPQQGVGSV